MRGSKFLLYNTSGFWNWEVSCVVWTNAFLLYYSHFSGYKWSPLLGWPFFLRKRLESFCSWKVYKLLIMFAGGSQRWSMSRFVCETEKVKLLFSALCMAFEHTLLLHASFKFNCQKYPYGFVLCLCFPNRLTCNFRRKGRLMYFCFALVGEEPNKYQQSKQNMQSSLSSMNDEIMGQQLFPGDWIIPQVSQKDPWDRAHPISVLSFLAVCSPLSLDVHRKVNLNGLSNILVSNLVDNEKWKNLKE